MTKNQTPYGHGKNRTRSDSNLSAHDYSNRTANAATTAITTSPFGHVLRKRGIYSMYRPAVDEILNQHGATDTTVVPEGNVFHLTAKFPDINSAELALAAIREITHRHRS